MLGLILNLIHAGQEAMRPFQVTISWCRRRAPFTAPYIDSPIDTAIIDLFLAHGAKISDTDLDGNTPLHLAARCLGQVGAVRFLLSRGADTNAENSKGNTPLHEVVDNPRWVQGSGITRDDNLRAQDEMLRELQEVGGNVDLMDQKNASGETPLQIRDEKRREWQEWDRKQLAERRRMGRGRGAAPPCVQWLNRTPGISRSHHKYISPGDRVRIAD